MFIQPKKKKIKSKQPVQIQAVARLLNIFTILYHYGLEQFQKNKKIAWLKIINHGNLNYMKKFHNSIYYHE